MRFLQLGFALALGCSSNDDTTNAKRPGVNACTQSGGLCAVNIPFTCTGGNTEAATDSVRATACGKSEGEIVRDIECCIPKSTPLDTGTPEDTSTEDGASDGATDATDAADAASSGDASEAG
jgi:hypothetical protein